MERATPTNPRPHLAPPLPRLLLSTVIVVVFVVLRSRCLAPFCSTPTASPYEARYAPASCCTLSRPWSPLTKLTSSWSPSSAEYPQRLVSNRPAAALARVLIFDPNPHRRISRTSSSPISAFEPASRPLAILSETYLDRPVWFPLVPRYPYLLHSACPDASRQADIAGIPVCDTCSGSPVLASCSGSPLEPALPGRHGNLPFKNRQSTYT